MKVENALLRCKADAIMKERGISVYKMSRDIKERQSTLNDIVYNKEMDSRRIPSIMIAKMKVYLNVSFDELFEVVEKEDFDEK